MANPVIQFVLRPGLSIEACEASVHRVGGIDGILEVHAFGGRSIAATVGKLYYARVDEHGNIARLLQRIASLDDVESAEIPAGRGLV